MVYELENNKTINLRSDKTFIIRYLDNVLEGTYIKSTLDTNKFIITFKTKIKEFLIYFDLDSSTVIGEDKNILKLKNLKKKSFESFFRNVFQKFAPVINIFSRTRLF